MKIKYLFLFLLVFFLFACTNPVEDNQDDDDDGPDDTLCTHPETVWVYDLSVKCEEEYQISKKCNSCDETVEQKSHANTHDHYEEVSNYKCTSEYRIVKFCRNCNFKEQRMEEPTGHVLGEYQVTKEPTNTNCGIKQKNCVNCNYKESLEFAYNEYTYHGKLSVVGRDLVDSNNEKMQLIGLSTHGLQWFGKYVNYDTFKAIKEEFGINVIRLAMYTAENGYCDGSASQRKKMYDYVVDGVEIATSLNLYVIIDWHMVGATLASDKNPLTFVNESMEFFSKISERFKDYDNVLYEIMNEPNGATTWKDCKEYAEKVIPEIRKNTDGIILIGNPKWTSDLGSIMLDPLDGYTNIMYTYHFYAAEHKSIITVASFYEAGFPVFISEHGGMEASGDGKMDYESTREWYSMLDQKNISYVAWNISNSKGAASILKNTNSSLTDFSDSGLKVWGRWFKIWTRTKANFSYVGFVDEENEK